MDFKKLKNVITLKDLLLTATALLGALGSIHWIEIPAWVFLTLFASYVSIRYFTRDEK